MQLVADGDPVMNVDCLDLLAFDPTVYQQMVSYPAEVMTIMDSEAQKLARQFQTEEDLAEEDEEGLGGLGILVQALLAEIVVLMSDCLCPWHDVCNAVCSLVCMAEHRERA